VGAPATRRQNLAVLASFYKWLCAMDPSCRNPTALVGVPKVNNRKPRALDDDVWRCVWRHALPVERAWLGLGFFTGLRPGELARLSAGHFRPESKEIVGFVRKGGNEGHVMCSQMAHLFHSRMPRLLPSIDDWLGPLSALASHRDPGEPLIPWHSGEPRHTEQTMERYGLMPGEVAPVVPARRLKVILRRANLHPNLFTPHALRHSFVGNTLAMGVPLHIVQRLADHASPGTTMRYGRSTQSMLDDWMG
jgi:integrase